MDRNLLIYAASERDANLYYATRFFAPDAFLYLVIRKKSKIILNDLEIDRGRSQAKVDQILSQTKIGEAIKKKKSITRPGTADFIEYVLKEARVQTVHVPEDFPLGLAADLQSRKIKTIPVKGMIFPEREFKTPREVKAIEHALRLTEAGMQTAYEVLKQSRMGKNKRLIFSGAPLTSEILRGEINAQIIRRGGLPAHTIVAGGRQACDPHERGHGPLSANQAIIVDIFPRAEVSGYFGDMTRTFVRGRAGEALKKLYRTVEEGQALAIRKIRPGVDGFNVHHSVSQYFEEQGFKTELKNGRMQGFFHGTGHGLGLEIHEAPRISKIGYVLQNGHVVTVEPGLYYPQIGGVRIEDVVYVSGKGNRVLSRFPKNLEI